jgi:hypothetical protein
MTKVKTTATGPKPLPKTHHERQLSSGVQLILLKTCYSSTTTINGVEQRYINTQSTGTSSTKILCPQQLIIADLKLWINEKLAQGNEEQINWNDYSIYVMKDEMLKSLAFSKWCCNLARVSYFLSESIRSTDIGLIR